MLRKRIFATSLVFASACSGSSSSLGTASGPGSGAPDATAGEDAAADAPPAYLTCGDAQAPSSSSCGTLSWVKSPVTARPRNHHLTEIVQTKSGPFLYEMGGFNVAGTFANVDSAPLNADGSVGKWTSQAPLPVALGGITGGAVGNVIVLAGGDTGHVIGDTSYSAVVQDDGSIAAWKTWGTIGHPRMHAGSFVVGNTIYVLGGFQDPSVWSDSVKATVQPDGTVSAWTAAGQLPGPRSHFSVSRVGNYVYMAGGLAISAYQNPPGLTDVSRAELAADGTLGGWTPMTALPVALATHASFVYGGYLYVAGGIYLGSVTANQEKRVWRTPIDATGALGKWEQVASLQIARGHVHQLPLFENHVYSVGGAVDFNLTATGETDVGTFQ
jgi:hypothetical protein